MQNCILYNSAFRVSVAAELLKIAFSLFGQFNLDMVGAVVHYGLWGGKKPDPGF